MKRRTLLCSAAVLWGAPAGAEPVERSARRAAAASHVEGGVVLERAVARFFAPDTGGAQHPHFVFARSLSFEARLEALADPDRGDESLAFRRRHLTAALERQVAETLLAGLHIDPEPTQAEITRQVQAARARSIDRAGGPLSFEAAARAEGVGGRDLSAILVRKARASLYLDRMVAPMLDPSEAELREVHRSAASPFHDLPFERAREPLRRWYAPRRLAEAVHAYYQNARGRVTLTLLADLDELVPKNPASGAATT